MTHDLGDAPIQDEYVAKMNGVARVLDEVFNGNLKGEDRTTGFILLVFPFGEDAGQRCNYISNGANREDVVALMKEQISYFEGMPSDQSGTA